MESPKQQQHVPIRFIVPNAITLLALSSGLTAIRMAFEGRFGLTVLSIMFAVVLDGIDGRAARLLNAASKFGAELDSLADFVNFGVAPGLILYFWTLNQAKPLGWIVSLIFAICICLRLARFNVESQEENQYKWKKKFFTGVPAPAGAFLALTPFYFHFLKFEVSPYIVLVWTVIVSLLTVSHWPTFSFKNMGTMPRNSVRFSLVLIILFASILATYRWETLIALSLIYLSTLPLSAISYRRYLKKELNKKAS